MNNNRLSTIILSVIMCCLCMAQPRSEREAMTIAKDFLSNNTTSQRAAANNVQLKLVSPEAISREVLQRPFTTHSASPQDVGFYIFNDEVNQRFVIVSGDERQYDILGYSEDGFFQLKTSRVAWPICWENSVGSMNICQAWGHF